MSYDRAKLKKVGDFYVPTYLISAGLISYVSVYINDIVKDINSPLWLFANDGLLYKVINCPSASKNT